MIDNKLIQYCIAYWYEYSCKDEWKVTTNDNRAASRLVRKYLGPHAYRKLCGSHWYYNASFQFAAHQQVAYDLRFNIN